MPRRPVVPGHAPRRLIAAVGIGTLALALAGCDLAAVTGPRTWTLGATNQAGTEETTRVTDRSGKVTNVEFDPAELDPVSPVTVPAGKPDMLDLTWTGGACDKTTEVTITGAGPGLAVAVKITPNGQTCDSIGLTRVIRLTLAQPVPPAAVTVTQ